MEFIESFFPSYNLENNGLKIENVQEVKMKDENCDGNNGFLPINSDSGEDILNLDEYNYLLNTSNEISQENKSRYDNVRNSNLDQNICSFSHINNSNYIFQENSCDMNCFQINFNVKQELLDNSTNDAINLDYLINSNNENTEEFMNIDNLTASHYLEADENCHSHKDSASNFTNLNDVTAEEFKDADNVAIHYLDIKKNPCSLNGAALNFVRDLGTFTVESSKEINDLIETREEIKTAKDFDEFLNDITEIVSNEQNTNADFIDAPYYLNEYETLPNFNKEFNTESVQSNDEHVHAKLEETKAIISNITKKADLALSPNNYLKNDKLNTTISTQKIDQSKNNIKYLYEFKDFLNKNNLNKENCKKKSIKFETDNIEEYETINASSDENNEDVISIDDNESNSSGYISSDFEFISEKEAKEFGIIDTKNNIKLKIIGINYEKDRYMDIKYRNLPVTDFSYREMHKIPTGNDFINLFRGGFEARDCSMLENKRPMPTMHVQYEGLGFDFGLLGGSNEKNNIIEKFHNEAIESRKKIVAMYPYVNRKRKHLS